MPGYMSLAAEIGDLILPVAMLPQDPDGFQIHIRLGVIVGKVRKLLHFVQGCALLYLQSVAADVLRPQPQYIL